MTTSFKLSSLFAILSIAIMTSVNAGPALPAFPAFPEPDDLPELTSKMPNTPIPRHLTELRLLLSKTRSSDTKYVPSLLNVTWKGVEGPKYQCFTDSVGLLTRLFLHSYGVNLSKYTAMVYPPKGVNFAAAVQLGGHAFKRITLIDDLIPGDIIFCQNPFNKDPMTAPNDYRVLVINDRPGEIPGRNPDFPNEYRTFQVSVIDCTDVGHGAYDSRFKQSGKYASGLGTGIFRFYVTVDKKDNVKAMMQKGTIAGYAWSTSYLEKDAFFNNSIFKNTEAPLYIGRFNSKIGTNP